MFFSEGWSLQQQTNGLAVNGCGIRSFNSNESNRTTSVPKIFTQSMGTAVFRRPLVLANRMPTASHDVVVRENRTQPPKTTLSEIPTCMTPRRLRSGAQLHSFYTQTWERLEGSWTEHQIGQVTWKMFLWMVVQDLQPPLCFQKNDLLCYRLYGCKLFSTGDFHIAGTHLRHCECQIQPSPMIKAHQVKPPKGVHLAPSAVSLYGLVCTGG